MSSRLSSPLGFAALAESNLSSAPFWSGRLEATGKKNVAVFAFCPQGTDDCMGAAQSLHTEIPSFMPTRSQHSWMGAFQGQTPSLG